MFVSSNSYVRVLLILIFFTSCNKEADIMKRNEVLIPYVISSSPDPLNILYSGDWAVTNHLWATLIDLQDDGSFKGILAKSWKRSSDGLDWTFELKENLRWSDGSILTASEVVKSLINSQKGTSHTDLSQSISSIKQEENLIKITLNHFLPKFLDGLTYSDWAIVFHEDIENGKLIKYSKFSGPYVPKNLNGSGVIDRIELEKNQNYVFQDDIVHSNAVIKSYSECEQLMGLSSKIGTFRSYKDDFSDECRAKLISEGFKMTTEQPSWIIKADFTKRAIEKITTNKRKSIIKKIQSVLEHKKLEVGSIRATGLRAPFLFGSLTENEFNSLLKTFSEEDINGLTLKLVTMDIWSKWSSFEFLVASLKKIGIQLQISKLSKEDFFKKFGSGQIHSQFDLIFFPLGVGDSDPDGTWRIASRYLYPEVISKEELSEAYREKNGTKREKYYKNFAKKLLENGQYIPLFMNSDIIGVHKSFKTKSGTSLRNGTSIFDLSL